MFITEWIRWGGQSDCLNSHKWKPSGNDFSRQVVPANPGRDRRAFAALQRAQQSGGFTVGAGFAGDSVGVMRSDL